MDPVPRRVRFHIEDDVVEEDDLTGEEPFLPQSPHPPPTPSPTYSVSTASSGPPLTPTSPGIPIVMESKGTSPVYPSTERPKLHPILSAGAVLSWDIAQHPTSMGPAEDEGDEAAASLNPTHPLTRLILVNEAVEDWPLKLEARDGSRFLTVNEVLSSLHGHLSKLVSREHFESQPPQQIQAITNAYRARKERWPWSGEGLRRIDYLPGRIFHGLRVKGLDESSEVWEFRFDVG